MRTKLTSMFALMFLFVATALHAQSLETEGTPLITDASQLSSNASDSAEGQHIEYLVDGDADSFWHTDWHGQCSDPYHYLQVALNEPYSGDAAIWLQRRAGAANDHPIQFKVEVSVDASSWTEIAIVDLPFEGAGTIAQSDFFTITDPVNYLRFSCTDTKGDSYAFRTFWHCGEFQVYGIEHSKELMIALQNVLLKYDAYLWGETFNMGTAYGQYTDTEAEATFMENLKKVDDILANMEEEGFVMPGDEEVEALIKTVEDAYAAVIASEVLYTVEDGYYRIFTHLPYYKNVPTGEKDGDGADITERQIVTKAMYSDLAGYGSWGTYDATDCRFVWKLTKDADDPTVVDFVNVATDYRLKDWASPITMAEDGELKVIFDWVGNEDGHDVLYIRNSTLAREPNASNYLHQLSHSRGAGNGDHLCNWRGTFDMGVFYDSDKGTSEWYLEPVSEEETQALIEAFAPYKDHDLLVIRFKDLIAQSEAAILKAQDASLMTKIAYDQPLISEASQLSSPWTEQAEGAIENLLDGDQSTFWHSDWHGNFPDDPIHYLNVELKEAYQGALSLYMGRRNNADNDHPTKLQVGASNDGENWVDIAQITAPFDGKETSCYFSTFTLPEAYKYVRFGALDCGGSAGYRTYWHAGEIQLYPATVDGQTQFENMGEVATNLAGLVEKGKAKADADVSVNDYDALTDAYQAFMDALIDPEALTSALTAAISDLNMVQVGEAPGFWADETAKAQGQALIDEVQTYSQAGKFDKATMDEYVKKLGQLKNDLLAQANKVNTNKWYRIRHMNADEYTLCGATTGYDNLYGQYIAVGHRVKETVENAEVEVAYAYTTDEMREGQNIFFFDEDQIKDMDVAMFRFVELPDGRYGIQNKASGLYISRTAEESEILTGFGPQSFEVKPIGYGQVLFIMQGLDGFTYNRPNLNAHSSTYGSLLKWWNDTGLGCNSTFIIEEAEDVEEDYAPVVKKDVVMGQFYPMYLPQSVQPSEGDMYEVVGTYVDDDKNYVAMNQIEEVSTPSMPFVYILGTPADYNEEAPETYTVEFTLGTDFSLTPGSKGGYIGLYSYRWVAEGSIVFRNNMLVSAEDALEGSRDVWGNTGYIHFGEVEADAEASGDYSLVMEIGGEMKKNPIDELGTPLITDAAQLSSNASDRDEGKSLAALVDGVPTSFWHTDWHNECTDEYHYLQVALNEEFTGDISLVMTRRAGAANDHPTQMKVWGSLDGENYFVVTTIELPFEGPGTTVIAEPFSVREPLKYLRFAATDCGSTGDQAYRTFWHCAEFQLYGIKGDAIERVAEEKTAPKGIFNINGIRVEKTTQGLYIINGKTVLVK